MAPLRSFAALRPAGWLLLVPAALLLTPLPAPAQTAPARPSALRRWWNSLGRGHARVTWDGRATTVTESGNGGPERTFQSWLDAAGALHEAYWEDGLARPVTPTVQQWAAARIQEARTPPPAPPAPPEPPIPPVPPPPPAFRPGEAGEAAFQQVQHHARLLEHLGSPVSLSPMATGSLHTWGRGEPMGWRHFTTREGAAADLTLLLTGPKGTAALHVNGERRGTVWTFSRLDLLPSSGPTPFNLLRP